MDDAVSAGGHTLSGGGQSAPPPSSPSTAMDRRVVKRPRRRLAWIGAGAGALLLTVPAWHLIPASGSTDVAAADAEIGTVSDAPFEDFLPVRATVAPAVTTFVGAVAGGQVEKLLVQDGAQVAAGQPLATLANPTLKLDILTREATIASQLGTVTGDDLALERGRLDRATQAQTAGYDLVKARRDLSVQQQLHDQGFVSDAGVASYREQADYQTGRLAQLRAGEASEHRIADLQARRLADTRARLAGNLAAVQASLDALTVHAPVAGRLTNFTVQPGQVMKPGDPVGQVDSEGAWKLVADVDEYYLGRVRVGQPATGEGGIALTVAKVLPTVAEGRFRVELTFRGRPPAGLNRGQAIETRITLGATRDAVTAPAGPWLDAGGGGSAFLVDPDGRHARRRPVRLGARNPSQVEVLSGLRPGDRIVTSSTAAIRGDILNIR